MGMVIDDTEYITFLKELRYQIVRKNARQFYHDEQIMDNSTFDSIAWLWNGTDDKHSGHVPTADDLKQRTTLPGVTIGLGVISSRSRKAFVTSMMDVTRTLTSGYGFQGI
eukprot:scaffold5463_cov155-Skeletonema_marinoi.AAC.8